MDIPNYKCCPVCGKKIIYIGDGYKMHICTNSSCRTSIKDEVIGDVDLTTYAEIQQKYDFNNKTHKVGQSAFMLLKEDLSGPMFAKNTNEALMKLRNTYCILRAIDKEDALKQFRQKYKVIKINDDMVVEIEITEV